MICDDMITIHLDVMSSDNVKSDYEVAVEMAKYLLGPSHVCQWGVGDIVSAILDKPHHLIEIDNLFLSSFASSFRDHSVDS